MSRNTPSPAPFKRRSLPLLMLQSREHLMTYFRPILNAQGITEQQWRIMRVLLESGPLEPRVIGESCRLSSASLTGVLARMQQLELVTRRRWVNDKRRLHIGLTARSRRIAAAIAPQVEAAYLRIERRLGARLCDALYRTLDAVVDKLEPSDSAGESAQAMKAQTQKLRS